MGVKKFDMGVKKVVEKPAGPSCPAGQVYCPPRMEQKGAGLSRPATGRDARYVRSRKPNTSGAYFRYAR